MIHIMLRYGLGRDTFNNTSIIKDLKLVITTNIYFFQLTD